MPALWPFGAKMYAGLRDVVLISEPAVTAPETLTSTSPILYSSASAPVATSAATLTRPNPTPRRNAPPRASRRRITFLSIAHPGRIYPRAHQPRPIHHFQDSVVNRGHTHLRQSVGVCPSRNAVCRLLGAPIDGAASGPRRTISSECLWRCLSRRDARPVCLKSSHRRRSCPAVDQVSDPRCSGARRCQSSRHA
jgi:hypothetical protein